MVEKIEALLICPMKKPERIFITDSLEDLQKAVGGYIEQFSNFDDDTDGYYCRRLSNLSRTL